MQVYAVCKADEHVPIEQVGTVEGMHGKLAGGTNVEGAVAVLQDRAAIQRHKDSLSLGISQNSANAKPCAQDAEEALAVLQVCVLTGTGAALSKERGHWSGQGAEQGLAGSPGAEEIQSVQAVSKSILAVQS